MSLAPLRLRPYAAPTESLSDRNSRLFWLFKVWIAVRHYFPHLEYASVDWTAALREWIPKVEAAHHSEEFFDLLRQMTAPLNDSHIRVVAPAGHPSRAVFYPPVNIGYVEGKVIITAVEDEAVGAVRAGDEVVSIDGRTIAQVEAHMRARVSASTDPR